MHKLTIIVLTYILALPIGTAHAQKQNKKFFFSKRKAERVRQEAENKPSEIDSVFFEANENELESPSVNEEKIIKRNITINNHNDVVSEHFTHMLDSLYLSWLVQNTHNPNFFRTERARGVSSPVNYPDTMYINRLQAIDSYIDLSFNETVKKVIELYTQRRPSTAETVLGLSSYYFPMIEEVFYRHGLPQELKYMAIIESALNPSARSHASAMGLWQFMYRTGRMYDLEINTYIDERCDPVKATEAAALFLSDMYKIYGDWHLAIASYNCGAGNVNKAIKRAGGKRNYWDIYYYLPKETRGYVPAFIAAAYFMNYYEEHNLNPKMPDFPIYTDTVMVYDYLHFEQVAKQINISVDELRAFNPQYIIDVIPARNHKEYSLCLPIDKISAYIEKEDSIYAFKRDAYFPNNEILKPKQRSYTTHPTDIKGKNKIQYTVKSGDVVGTIAEKFNVRSSDLRAWNNIRGNLIKVGQKLTIYVPANSSSKSAEKTNTSTQAQNTSSSNGWTYYTVKQGDSLWSIARQFAGVSAQNIMDANGMKNNNIKPGQKLKIKKN